MKPQLDPKLVERVAKAIFRAVSRLDNDGTPWTQFVEEPGGDLDNEEVSVILPPPRPWWLIVTYALVLTAAMYSISRYVSDEPRIDSPRMLACKHAIAEATRLGLHMLPLRGACDPSADWALGGKW